MELEADYERSSRHRGSARVSTRTKLTGTKKVTPTKNVESTFEHYEQMSIRMSELERAVHVERESLREEMNRKR